AAYESGAVSDDFDLGTDYTRPITRAQMARLTVDLVLDEQQTTLPALAGELGIQLEMAPLSPAEEAAEAETGAESVPAASDPDEGLPADAAEEPAETDAPPTGSEAGEQTAAEEPQNGDPLDGGLPAV